LVKEKKQRKKDRLTRPFVREFSAGGVVFKKKSKKTLWLITKSSPSKLIPQSYWRLPKGWLDDVPGKNMPGTFASGKKKAEPQMLIKAALREVAEEAGIRAKVIQKIGTDSYSFVRGGERVLKFATYFLMQWEADLPQGFGFETQEIDWLDFENAYEKLKNSGEKRMLKKAWELRNRLNLQPNLI
jgi:8-oxo-dGTP pyrophosphatase MutT (NUDIX family)